MVTISPREITITAPDATANYGDASATFDPTAYTITAGFLYGSDFLSLTCAVDYNSTLAVNTYPGAVTCTDSTDLNYTVSVSPGNLVVGGSGSSRLTPTITITVNPPNLFSGTSYTPTGSSTSGDLVIITVDPSSSSVCSIDESGVLTFLTPGICTLNFTDPGSSTYGPATTSTQYTVVTSNQFTATFVIPAGVPGSGSTSVFFTFGQTITMLAATSITQAGLQFLGWRDGQGNVYSAGAICFFGGDVTLTAQVVRPTTVVLTVLPANTKVGTSFQPAGAARFNGLNVPSDPVTITLSTNSHGCTLVSGRVAFITVGATCILHLHANAIAGYLASDANISFLISSATTGGGTTGHAPAPPTNVLVTQNGSSGAIVTWTKSPSTGSSAPTSYQLISQPAGITCAVSAPTTRCSVSGLTRGVHYVFKVRAANSRGNSAYALSSPAFVLGSRPTPPTNIAANVNPSSPTVDKQAYISWSPPSSSGGLPVVGYIVSVQPGNHHCYTTATVRHCLLPLDNGTSYTYSVQVVTDPLIKKLTATSRPRSLFVSTPGTTQWTPFWQNQATTPVAVHPNMTGALTPTMLELPVTLNFSTTSNATSYSVWFNGANITGNQPPVCRPVGSLSICSFTFTPANYYILRASDSIIIRSNNHQMLVLRPLAPRLLPVATFPYATNSSTPNAVEQVFLQAMAQWLVSNNYTSVTLAGYTDDAGIASQNLTLSQARADEAAAYLRAQLALLNVTNISVTGVGYGVSTTYGSGCNPAQDPSQYPTALNINCAMNRRVILEVSGQNTAPIPLSAPMTQADDASVSTQWNAAGTGGLPITQYAVYFDTYSDFAQHGSFVSTSALGGWQLGCSTTSTSCSVSGLTNGTPYVFVVVATNALGDSIPAVVSVATTPSAN